MYIDYCAKETALVVSAGDDERLTDQLFIRWSEGYYRATEYHFANVGVAGSGLRPDSAGYRVTEYLYSDTPVISSGSTEPMTAAKAARYLVRWVAGHLSPDDLCYARYYSWRTRRGEYRAYGRGGHLLDSDEAAWLLSPLSRLE